MWEWPLPVVLQTLQCHFEVLLIPWENICQVKVLSCKSWVGPTYLYLLTCLFCVTSNIFKISHLWCSFTPSISIFKGALCDPAKWFLFYLKWMHRSLSRLMPDPNTLWKSHKCPGEQQTRVSQSPTRWSGVTAHATLLTRSLDCRWGRLVARKANCTSVISTGTFDQGD